MLMSGFGLIAASGFPGNGCVAQAGSALIATVDGPHCLIVKDFTPHRLCFVDYFVQLLTKHDSRVMPFSKVRN